MSSEAKIWTAYEKDLVRAMFKLGKDDKEIGAVVGRSVSGVRKMRSTIMGLKHMTHSGGSELYNEDEDAVIRDGFKMGLTDVGIAASLPGRTYQSVRSRRETLGLKGNGSNSAETKSTRIARMRRGERQCYPTDPIEVLQAASILHLADIKRAGHNRRVTELSVPSYGLEQVRFFPKATDDRTYTGSQAAMCAGV